MQQIEFSFQQVKESLISAWEAAWDHGHVDALDTIFHPEFQRVSSQSGNAIDAEALKQDILDVRAAFPDLVTTIDHLLVDEGEQSIAIFWHTNGTFSNDLQGVPATGSTVETRGSNLLKIQEGLVISEQVTWDQSALLADLGVPSLKSAFEGSEEGVVVDDLSGVPNLEALKGFNRQFITGVTVVTTKDENGKPRGLAANSYVSVSLEPPLVLVCVQKTTSTYSSLFKSTHLGINIMSNEQRGTVGVFASKGEDKFAELDWHEGPNGSPLIDGSAASIEAEIKERFQAKTHTVFIAKVKHSEVAQLEPMVYKAGRFYDGAQLTAL
ncbi:flavin reductase [Glutamicibacter protophormiae]|uniref:flavin reductase n=1 Tax=Glutamicibacter protophormiae TaxID=37930 RepID=UPI00195CB35D|nr:flavin reductase [Glutamicibacter protophormiae]QRQ78155.1 flavin reductase [Glutamicibacter protophormiae]